MHYKLVKKLGSAGFPLFVAEGRVPAVKVGGIYLRLPTLEELIEACGEDLSSMGKQADGRWYVTSKKDDGNGNWIEACSPDLTEAVANLWLALNEK